MSLLLLACALGLVYTDWLWRWDQLLYDSCLRLWPYPVPADVVIVAIDERSLLELGRWPWSRRLHAALLAQLTRENAKIIALDILFAEPDLTDPEGDLVLAKAIKNNGRIILPVVFEQLGGQLVETLPIPPLTEAAASLGHVDVELDRDSIARNVYLKAGLGTPYWPSLGLAMLALNDPSAWRQLPGQRTLATRPSSPYVWARDYRIGIAFAGPPGQFAHISYIDVLRGDFLPDTFRDKFVFVGVTATGLGEALATPVSGLTRPMPGVEVSANVLNTLHQGLAIEPLELSWRLWLTSFLTLLPGLLYGRLTPREALIATVLLLLLIAFASMALLRGLHVWCAPAPALLTLLLSYPLLSWRHLESALRSLWEEKERARVTLHSIGDAVITTNAKGALEYMNPAAEALTGYSIETTRGLPLAEVLRFVKPAGGQFVASAIEQCLSLGRVINLGEHSGLVNQAGQPYAIRASAAPIRGQRNEVWGVVLTINDVTETRRLAKQMAYQASHDALTQLPNRTLLRDRLTHAIARAQRNDQQVSVLFVDLDHFKKVNDSLGHAAGDSMLKAVAARLKTCLREEDTIARLGGDEFVILVENLLHEELAGVVSSKVVEALRAPFLVEGHEFFITASIGISSFPKDGGDEQALLKNADTAMYRAKERGRNTFQYYEAEMNIRALERLMLENSLRHALERGELLLYYQPQVALENERIIGVEALLRWRDPLRGMISPAQFIPLAEETGLILPIGEWVLKTACAQAKAWQEQGLPALRVAVNLSARQFIQADLPDRVAAILQETDLETQYLELEITESLLMQDVEGAIVTLDAFKAMGVNLSIDDFGTGYSSLNYLKRFPLDRLKIDQSFVRDITTDQDGAAIALAIIAMAHSMGLRVVAEGVETAAQLDFLRVKQCDEMQGYYFSRPVPAEDIALLLQNTPTLRLAGGH